MRSQTPEERLIGLLAESSTTGMPWTPMRLCPVCGGRDGESLHKQRLEVLDDYPLTSEFEIVLCSTSGMVYTDTSATQGDYDKFYATCSVHQNPAESITGEIPSWEVPRLHNLANIIASCAPSKEARILDVGCSSGGLLQILSGMGFRNCVGVDPSPVCVANARSNGIEAYRGEAGTIPTPIGHFDLVMLTGVLEHVLDVQNAVASLVDVCSTTGIIFFEVPDAGRYADFLHAPFQDFNTEHINHFSRAALRNLMSQFGFLPIVEDSVVVKGPSGLELPCLAVAFERQTQEFAPNLWSVDEAFRQSIQRYIDDSRLMMARLNNQLREALASAPEVIVWGVGQLTMKLLRDTALREARVIAFIDGNPIYKGKRLREVPVLCPEEVPNQKTPIIISSLLHVTGIVERIALLKLHNPIITLRGR